MYEIKLRGHRLSLLIGFVGAMAFCLQGYDQAVINGLLTLPTWESTFPSINTQKNKNPHVAVIEGTAVAIYEVGCAIGALSCFVIGDILGRRKTIFGATCIVLIGVAIQASSFSLGQLIAARVITGLGVGAFTATVPAYVTESAKAHGRGKLVMLEGMFAIGGIVIAVWLDFGFFFLKGNSANWRFPIAFQAVFAIVVLTLVLGLPESPRWLIRKENYEGATRSLSRLNDLPESSTLLQQEVAAIREAISFEHVGDSSNPFAMTKNRHLQRTMIAICINLLAQMTGVNIVTFYSNTIFQEILGYSGTISRVISGCLQIWQLCFATLAVFLIDRVGRRPLLLTCSAGMVISQAGLAALTKYSHVSQSVAGASLLFYFLPLAFFPVGLFLIPFMYAAEIAPLRIRAKVTAMSSATNWLFNFLIAEVTPVGFANIGWKYYLCYMCSSCLAFTFVYFFCPETKNRGLEDIDEFFLRSSNIFETVKIARELPEDAGLTTAVETKLEEVEHRAEASRRESQA